MSDKQSEKWLGIRREGDQVSALFAMPSGRIREIPLTRDDLHDAIADAARALKFMDRREERP